MWNSGRLTSMIAIVSPFWSPSAASPAAVLRTSSSYSLQVSSSDPSRVFSARRSGTRLAVNWKTPGAVPWSSASWCGDRSTCVAISIPPFRDSLIPRSVNSCPARQPIDVVRQPQNEQPDYEHEADHPCPLHNGIGDRPPAHELDKRPEDVPAIERQEREQVDDRQRQRDHCEQEDRVAPVVRD